MRLRRKFKTNAQVKRWYVAAGTFRPTWALHTWPILCVACSRSAVPETYNAHIYASICAVTPRICYLSFKSMLTHRKSHIAFCDVRRNCDAMKCPGYIWLATAGQGVRNAAIGTGGKATICPFAMFNVIGFHSEVFENSLFRSGFHSTQPESTYTIRVRVAWWQCTVII